MTTLPLKKSEGHFIVNIDGDNYIIDTGASESCSCFGQTEIAIGDRKFKVYPLPLEKVGEKISELVHMPIVGLIGLDIMKKLGSIEISEEEGYVRFGGETVPESGDYTFPFRVIEGYSILTSRLNVNGKDAMVILDTGARIDYMDPIILDTSTPVSHERDYNPIIGYFEVDGYKATYRIGDREIETVSYAATDQLKDYVSQMGINDISGVVGLNAFLKGMKSLTLDFINRRVILKA
ncbi:MAG: hypothetical protein ACI4NM_02610 [Bullifex sp.]